MVFFLCLGFSSWHRKCQMSTISSYPLQLCEWRWSRQVVKFVEPNLNTNPFISPKQLGKNGPGRSPHKYIFQTYRFHNSSTDCRDSLKIKKIPLYIRNLLSIKVLVARLERPKTNLKIKSVRLESSWEATQNSWQWIDSEKLITPDLMIF